MIYTKVFGKKTPQAGGVPPRLEEKIDARSGVRVHADGTRNAAHFEVHKILAAFRPRSLLRSMFACVRPAKNMGRRVLTNFASNISSEKFHLEYSYIFLPESPFLVDAASRSHFVYGLGNTARDFSRVDSYMLHSFAAN